MRGRGVEEIIDGKDQAIRHSTYPGEQFRITSGTHGCGIDKSQVVPARGSVSSVALTTPSDLPSKDVRQLDWNLSSTE